PDLLLSVKQKLLFEKHCVLFTILLISMIGFGFTSITKVALQGLPFPVVKDSLMVFCPGVLKIKEGLQLILFVPSPLKSHRKLDAPIVLQLKKIGSPTQAGPDVEIKQFCASAVVHPQNVERIMAKTRANPANLCLIFIFI